MNKVRWAFSIGYRVVDKMFRLPVSPPNWDIARTMLAGKVSSILEEDEAMQELIEAAQRVYHDPVWAPCNVQTEKERVRLGEALRKVGVSHNG